MKIFRFREIWPSLEIIIVHTEMRDTYFLLRHTSNEEITEDDSDENNWKILDNVSEEMIFCSCVWTVDVLCAELVGPALQHGCHVS